MSINYTSVFTRIGTLVGRSNSYATLASTTLVTDLQTIVSTFGTGTTTYGTVTLAIQNINSAYEGLQNSAVNFRTQLGPFITNVITDTDTVVSQIPGLNSTAISDVLPAIIEDMVINSQTVKANVVSVGSVTNYSENVGNGTALVDKKLDGYNSPVQGGLSTIFYDGLESELSVPSETMVLTCTSDSGTGTATEGSEGWSWNGGINYQLFDYHPEGSGSGPSLTTANGYTSVIQNLGFEDFTSNAPNSWTIDSGAAGTTIFEETDSSKIYRGDAALRFTGDGTTATIQISQTAADSGLTARRRYCVTMTAFRDGSAPGAGSLLIYFSGTGYTASSTEKINVALTALTGTYTTYSFYLNVPPNVPSDMALVIKVTGTLNNGANIYLDSGSCSPVTYNGGVNCVILAGSTPWCIGDTMSFTVANTTTGKFQNYFRQAYQCQLPSVTDGSQTINDSLASS